MRHKILIDPHPFLDSVQNWLQDRYDVEFLYLGSAIQNYIPKCTSESYLTPRRLNLKNDTLSIFPSWFTENTPAIERLVIQSLKDQSIKYGPCIEAMDLCLQNEDISLILLWNDVTALTKSLTFLGRKHGIPSLHVSHGIPGRVPVHGKIWADKIAVFGESSRELYITSGNPAEKIVITGNPYWDNWGPCSSHDVEKIKEALGLNRDKKVVMFAPTWYHNFNTADDPELKIKRDLEILLDTISQLKLIDKVDLLVKLHGGHKDKTVFYERRLKARDFSYKIFCDSSPLPLIQVSDVVLCAGSMVVETLLAKKPLIYHACEHYLSPQHFDYVLSPYFNVNNAPFYVALNRTDLSRDLSRALDKHEDFSDEEIKKFLHRQNGPCDGKATERVAELSMEMAENNKNKEKRVKFISPVSYEKRETYYSNIREDIPSMITGSPERILEVGCAEGAMGELLKKRHHCEYVGVEINSEAAHKSEERLDRVIIADVEKTNLEEYRIAETGFDYIIYGDVLEHLYDPWTLLHEHKKLLKDDGYVVVSIPNVRNLTIIESLVNGSWTYKDEGILDSTHLRFFTLQEVKKMFVNCGYAIVDVKCITTPFCDHDKIQGAVNIDLPKMTIKNVSKEELLELSTVQFIIKAQKINASESVRLPKSSIIIPVFNQVEYTKQCMEALYKNTPNSLFEIIVVDNNSTDGTKEFLSGIQENIKIISNPENLGFAKACNQGAKEASGKFLLFLNNDTVPLSGWLEEMVHSVNSDVDVGIVGSKLLYPDGTIQHAGIEFINGIPDHPFRNLPGEHPEANVPKELDMVTGACLLIKRDLFFECGGFDEQYKNGVEDIDLCLKVRLKDHKVVYNPKSTLYHYEGRTPGRFDHVKENLETFFSRWGDYFDEHGKFCNKAANQNRLIKWEGSQFVNHSLALVNRELCIELAKRDDIELSLIPYEPDEFSAEEDPERFGLIAERLNSPLSAAADFHVRHQWPPNFTPPPEGHWIIIQPWEFGALPKDWVEPMETLVDELWVPSKYVRDVYVRSGISASKVFVVPNGVNYHQFNPAVPEYKLDTQKRFKFLFVGGTIGRKGIDVLLSAYTEAFTSEDDVCLVIKDMGGESFYKGQNASQMIEDIKNNPASPEILYLSETLKPEEIAGLYTACGCLVHPYRGEGFGLPVAEAMACGLPVIVTKGGACDDFCSDESAYFIDSTQRPVQLNSYVLSAPGWLLEPNKAQLIEMLKWVYEHPGQAREKGAIAANQIKTKVDWKMASELIVNRLKAMQDKPIRRFASSAQSDLSSNDVKTPEAMYEHIQASMENKRPQEVIKGLELLIDSYPEFALAHNDLGALYYKAGNREKALKFYENAVQLDPGNMIFQKNLADFYYVEMGRVEDASRIYSKILEANPEDVETLLIAGHICVSLHKFEDAQVFYHRVLELEPLNEAAQENLEKLNQMGSIRSELKSAEDMYQEIQPLLNNGDPHKAIASLEKLLENYPDFGLAQNDLGVIHYHIGNKEKAQYHYERAVELTPDNINFQKNLADFYCIELGRIEDALKIYVRILKTDPQDVETLMATGQICNALEKPDDARDFFNQVLQIEPWNADARKQIEDMERPPSGASLNSESAEDAYRRLLETLNTLTPEGAIVELEKLVESYPDFAIAHNELAVLYYNIGNKEKSLRYYQQAAHLQPGNMTLQKNLADFLFVELGKVEDALQIYVDLLVTYPDDVDTLLITGHICVALKKFDDAKNFYERVLALEPGNQDANNNLQALINRQNGRSSARPDSLNDETVSSAKDEAADLSDEESEKRDAEHQPTVSIFISLDGIQNRVKQCIESISTYTEEPHEIILINSGATKGLLKWAQNLVRDNAHYQLVKCDKMHTWAQGLNQAVKAAAGEYVVLMHNDVMVAECWLRGMLQCFRAGSGIGVVGPMTNATSGIQKAYFSEERDPNRLESDAQAFYAQNQYRRIPTTKLASFCLMFRRELIDKIGDFDVQLVSEQALVADFCKRSAAWGFRNLVAGDVFVYHADRHKGSRKTSDTVQLSAADQKRLKENWNKTKRDRRFLKGIQVMSLLEKADKLHQKGYIDQAVETLLNAIGAVPEETRLYLALAEISISLKRYQDAIDTLDEMPTDAKTEMDSEESGHLNEPGLQSPSMAVSENHEMKTLEILGYAEEGLENFVAAEAYADRMLAIDPKSARALNLKGILAYRKEDPNSAEQFFEKAAASDPGAGEPYSNLATVKLAASQEEEAWDLFEKAFILNPTDLDIATNYHSLVAARGEHKRAEEVVRGAAAVYPNNQKINYMLIDVLLQQGKHDEAMGKIEAAIIKFGIEDGILAAALKVREKLEPMAIQPSKKNAAVSCCMIIKDEEKYLARCLASVKPIADEIIVVDTGSADRSKDIATAFGAQVYDLEWQKDFAKARNFSLEKASGDWVLILDGDEVISSLDYKAFNRIVKNRPKAPVAYTIVTRNYSALANIVGWVPNDGKYVNEEAAAGWIPSIKTRLFYGKDQIWFEGAVHELVDPVVNRKGFETKQCSIPVHHYGRLDKERLKRKGEVYFEIGKKKMEEMGDDIFAVREMAIQATTLEENEMAIELWQKLISLDPTELMAADAYINMATLYNRLSNFDQALWVAKKAVAKAPHIKESLYNYALAELHVGNAQTTIKILEDLIKRMPDYPPAHFILSAAYFCVGEKEKGFKMIQELQGTDLGPNLVYPVFELAETLLEAQRNEYALLLLGTAIEYDIVNKQILELFNKCIQMRETPKNSAERPRPLPPDRESINFENLPQ